MTVQMFQNNFEFGVNINIVGWPFAPPVYARCAH
jgi:hypothetical protein